MRVTPGILQHPDSPIPCKFTQTKQKKTLTFGDGFVCAANAAGLGCIPLRSPCPIHALDSPLCTPVKSQFCTLYMLLCMVPGGLCTPGAPLGLGTGWGACGTLSSH